MKRLRLCGSSGKQSAVALKLLRNMKRKYGTSVLLLSISTSIVNSFNEFGLSAIPWKANKNTYASGTNRQKEI